MNEENQTNTTENSVPKKKSGKAKKIIIAVVIIAVIAAIVVGILFFTGKLDNVNLSKKSKMVAGVEKLTEAYTKPFDTISEKAGENGTVIKVFNNLKEDSAIGVSAEVSANIEELDIASASSSEKANIESVKDLLNDLKFVLDARYDGKEAMYANVKANLDDVELAGEVLYDGTQAGIRSEQLSKKWLTFSKADIAAEGVDVDEIEKQVSTMMSQFAEIAKAAEVDEKTQKEIEKKYNDVLKDFVNEKSKDIETEKATIKVNGKDKKCEKLTLKLTSKDIQELLIDYVEVFEKDEKTQEILKDVLKTVAETAEQTGGTATIGDVDEMFDEMMSQMDVLKEEIKELEFDGKIILDVYATNTDVYRTDITLDIDGGKIVLETEFNKNETVTTIKAKAGEDSMEIATITVKSEDNAVNVKVVLGSFIQETLKEQYNFDDEVYFEMNIKEEKSKAEVTFTLNAGELGHGTISVKSEITKNEDKEYADTATVSLDIDVPDAMTIKMSIDAKSNIKVGDVSIPTISKADSVSINDQEALAAYVEEIKPEDEKLVEKLMNVKSLKPFIEEGMSELSF